MLIEEPPAAIESRADLMMAWKVLDGLVALNRALQTPLQTHSTRTHLVLARLHERFWRFVNKTDSCWLYTGDKDRYGYGMINVCGRKVKAHRLAYTLTGRVIPRGMLLCHKCDVRSCVNPDHFFIGTHQDNTDDMMAKERHRVAVGERASHSKLTAEQVNAIRREYANGGVSLNALARRFNVSNQSIHAIVSRKSWTHI